MGVLPPIQHTMPLMQPTIVLATQAPTLGVLPSMGINFSVVDSASDGGGNDDDAGGDRVQKTEDDVPGVLIQDVVKAEKKAPKIMTMM